MQPKQIPNFTLKPGTADYVFRLSWLVLPFIAFLPKGSMSAKLFGFFLLELLIIFITYHALSARVKLLNNTLYFISEQKGLNGKKTQLALNDVKTLVFGRPGYVSSVISNNVNKASTVASVAVAGVISPAAAGMVASQSVQPVFAIFTNQGDLHIISASPFSKEGCRTFLGLLQQSGAQVDIQQNYRNTLKI